MAVEAIDTLIVGGGQAGLAVSEQLSRRGCAHLIVERHRIIERWRSERWDGLHGNGTVHTDHIDGFPYPGLPPDAFATRDQIVAYFCAYADAIKAPVRCGVEVSRLSRMADGGFLAQTAQGDIAARRVIVATGPFQRPMIPGFVPQEAGLFQVHASGYRNPAQLPRGAVLVVGAGSSGAQIAEELRRAGRQVFLSVGGHVRGPRRYRGHDIVSWMKLLGLWDVPAGDPPPAHVTLPFSGAYGGETVDFRVMARRGVHLLGRVEGFEAGVMRFACDLAANLAKGDAAYLGFLDAVDAYIDRTGLDLPPDPAARVLEVALPSQIDPPRSLDLAAAGISAIVWATGYGLDFSWIDIPVLDDRGRPKHRRGVSDIAGLYFLGLPWLSKRSSSFLYGIVSDATYLAEHIAQRG